MNTSMSQEKKKKTKQNKNTHKNTWNITIFCINKENKKKKRLIKDKVQIENVDMRIIKWPQQFHKKSYVTSC